MEHMESLHSVLKEYLAPGSLPNDVEFLGIYGRLCINSFNILDDDLNSVGTGIYLAASILDHSCKPNAVATFDGPQISIRLIEDIPELNWDKIRISYIDQMDLPETRCAELKKTYYFDCDCERCKDTSIAAKMEAMSCPNDSKDCDGYIAVTDEKCSECDTPITDEHRQRFADVTDMTKQALQEMQNTRCEFLMPKVEEKFYIFFLTDIDMCRNLDKNQNKVLHKRNIWRLKSLDLALDASIDHEFFDEAVEFGKKFVDGLK